MEGNCFKTYQEIKKQSNKSTIIIYKELVNLLDSHDELKFVSWTKKFKGEGVPYIKLQVILSMTQMV